MSNLSDKYSVRYKTRDFAKNGVKNISKLKHFRNHIDLPPFLPGSKTEIQLMWDFLTVEKFIDTSFIKNGYSYENQGWGFGGNDNYGTNVPQEWACYLGYNEGSTSYTHRVKDHEGTVRDEIFYFKKQIAIDPTLSPSDGSQYTPGSSIGFTGVVVGDTTFTYELRLEYENENISDLVSNLGAGTLGNQYVSSVFPLPEVSQIENVDFVFEVTWSDGIVQTDRVTFQVVPAPNP